MTWTNVKTNLIYNSFKPPFRKYWMDSDYVQVRHVSSCVCAQLMYTGVFPYSVRRGRWALHPWPRWHREAWRWSGPSSHAASTPGLSSADARIHPAGSSGALGETAELVSCGTTIAETHQTAGTRILHSLFIGYNRRGWMAVFNNKPLYLCTATRGTMGLQSQSAL